MAPKDLTRREFMLLNGSVGAGLILGIPVLANATTRRPLYMNTRKIYRRAAGGRRVSRAALSHNANRRYARKSAALSDLPHPGDTSFFVELHVSYDEFARLFVRRVNGRLRVFPVADLRKL